MYSAVSGEISRPHVTTVLLDGNEHPQIFLWVGGPVYIFFALIPALAGSAVARFELRWLYILIAVTVIFGFMGVWIHKRYGKAVIEIRTRHLPSTNSRAQHRISWEWTFFQRPMRKSAKSRIP